MTQDETIVKKRSYAVSNILLQSMHFVYTQTNMASKYGGCFAVSGIRGNEMHSRSGLVRLRHICSTAIHGLLFITAHLESCSCLVIFEVIAQ